MTDGTGIGHGTRRAYRVLHIITRLVHGGAQENTILTAHGLRPQGFEPWIATGLAQGPEGDLTALARQHGISLIRVPELVRDPDPVKDLAALVRLARLIQTLKIDLVHTHTSKAGFIGRIAAMLAKAPAVVHTPHGHIFHDYYGLFRTSLYIMLERVAARHANRILTLSRRERRDHVHLGIGLTDDFVHVPSGVDFSRFEAPSVPRRLMRKKLQIPEDAFVAGSVGRLAPVKGHRYLLEAASLAAGAVPDLYVVLAGDGELRQELAACAEALGMAERVVFTGLVKDIPALLGALDVAVFPSLNEGMGRAIAEAMASEVPVIATWVGGIPELLAHGSAGMLVPPHSAPAIARALIRLHQDPEQRARFAFTARAHVSKEYSLGEMLRRIETVYRDVLADRSSGPRPRRENPQGQTFTMD